MHANEYLPRSHDYHRVSFRAMNTHIDAAYWCVQEEMQESEIKNWFAHVERRFSRFDPYSELSYLNRLTGERCLISDDMLEVLIQCDKFRLATEGIFNPLILQALLAEGYDTSFEKLPDENTVKKIPQNIQGVMQIDPRMKSVELPNNLQLDLGGIVKSWAVKRAARRAQNQKNVSRGMINAGGDLTVWDLRSDETKEWEIDITHPWHKDETLGVLTITNGSAATSGVMRRKWMTDKGIRHHLIDTRTMQSSDSDVAQCTVFGPDIMACEVWAKVICILGNQAGLRLFQRHCPGYDALIFTKREELMLASDLILPSKHWNIRGSYKCLPMSAIS
jgi:thiamine biosynthesis lipoprotein